MMEAGTAQEVVTEAELVEAERGFILMLKGKRFPREWIEENAADLMAQAHKEYAERLAEGREDTAVGLLIVIAYRRAVNLLDAQQRRPKSKPLDDVLHLADESAPTPEDEAIDHDRERRVAEALRRLPEKDRRLMAMVYFEGYTIRAAGRVLGWGKSAADQHHKLALDRLRPYLGKPDLWSPSTVVLVWVAAQRERWAGNADWVPLDWTPGGIHFLSEPAAFFTYRVTEGWRRVWPFAEPGNAAAVGGAGRGVAATCAGVLICAGLGTGATGVIGPGLPGVPHVGGSGGSGKSEAVREEAQPASATFPTTTPEVAAPVASPSAKASRRERPAPGATAKPEPTAGASRRPKREPDKVRGEASAPATVGEFGADSGSYEPPPSESSGSSPSGSGSAPSSAAPSSSAGSAADKTGSSVASEFGM